MPKGKKMSVSDIPVITVSYNSPELVGELISSFRSFYTNKIYVIDGSNLEIAPKIKQICSNFLNVEFIHFDYNIHHGPGMAWAFSNIGLSGKVLVLDSDIVIVRGGFLESLLDNLEESDYGIGVISIVNEEGFDIPNDAFGIRYLHPACMLCNLEIVKRWPLPVKHGAPMFEAMRAIHNAGKSNILKEAIWLRNDFDDKISDKKFLIHNWQGTVKVNQGYGLDEWLGATHRRNLINQAILSTVPLTAKKILEIGENDGYLARNIKGRNSGSVYISYQNLNSNGTNLKSVCDQTIFVDFDQISYTDLLPHSDADFWIIDKALERMNTPSILLDALYEVVDRDSDILAIVPNSQNIEQILQTISGALGETYTNFISTKDKWRFSLKSVTELFARHRFSIIDGSLIYTNKTYDKIIMESIQQILAQVDPGGSIELKQLLVELFIFKIRKI